MSEITRAQIRVLMERADGVIRRSQELRRQLDIVMKRIEESGFVGKGEAERRVAKRKASK